MCCQRLWDHIETWRELGPFGVRGGHPVYEIPPPRLESLATLTVYEITRRSGAQWIT